MKEFARNGRNGKRDRGSDHRVESVYFLATRQRGKKDDAPIRIKIGISDNVLKRFKQHLTPKHGVEFDGKGLCALRGTENNEKTIHRYFDFCRLKIAGDTETFEPAEALVDYIRWLRDQYFVWRCEDGEYDPDEVDAVESTCWLPTPERRKKVPSGVLPFDEFWGLNLSIQGKSEGDDFYTSEVIIEPARRVLQHIDLDPASHPEANRIIRAKKIYTLADDGLLQPWHGRIWLNPPFSNYKSWVHKSMAELAAGHVEQMCILCATRTLTAQYFSPIKSNCQALALTRGRIRFGGNAGDSPDDGHAIFYFGPNVEAFVKEFDSLCHVFLNPHAGRFAAQEKSNDRQGACLTMLDRWPEIGG